MDNTKPRIVALVVAAGTGARFGNTALPKQYTPLLGKPLLCWSMDTLREHPAIDDVVAVIHPEHQLLFARATQGTNVQAITGGATRQQSVRMGLEALAATANPPDFVLIHDAARPCLSVEILNHTISALYNGVEAVMPALPVTDTIRRYQENNSFKTENRDKLYTVQTPQAFAFPLIHDLHQRMQDEELTDDIALVEKAGGEIFMIAGDLRNIKITYPDSLSQAMQYIAENRSDIRTGTGYDVHRLVTPRNAAHKLIIGGIEMAHDMALEGHSDADVGLHAITDALLGAIGDGDIGMHFSPKDNRWKNANSADFLVHARNLVTGRGGAITHVDLTVICEAPKIGPYRDVMRNRIAEILNITPDRVSIKATTTETLGFTGRGEGIAAEAAATVRLPFVSTRQQALMSHITQTNDQEAA